MYGNWTTIDSNAVCYLIGLNEFIKLNGGEHKRLISGPMQLDNLTARTNTHTNTAMEGTVAWERRENNFGIIANSH